jgi:hypothetical protein
MPRRGVVARAVAASVLLVLELPVLLPIIGGTVVMALIMGVPALARRLRGIRRPYGASQPKSAREVLPAGGV